MILLNGASCSGKSSLARALVKAFEEDQKRDGTRWHRVSIDGFFQESLKTWEAPEGSSKEGAGGLPFYWHRISGLAKQFDPFHARVRELLESGQSVILDHCLAHDAIFKNALYHFRNVAVLFVQLPVGERVAWDRLRRRNEGSHKGYGIDGEVDSDAPSEVRLESYLRFHLGKAPLNEGVRKAYYRQLPLDQQVEWPLDQLKCKGLAIHSDKVYSLSLEEEASVEAWVSQVASALETLSEDDRSFFQEHQPLWERVRRYRFEVDAAKGCFIEREQSSFEEDYLSRKGF